MATKREDRKRAKIDIQWERVVANQEIMTDHGLLSDRRKPHGTHAVCRGYNTTCDL